jgi:hypothetical protein
VSNRKTRLFRLTAPSRKQQAKRQEQVAQYASIVDALCITLVKEFGSSLKAGEWSLTIPASSASLARPHEHLTIVEGPNREVILTVRPDPDIQAQIDAFNAELSATSPAPLVEVENG